MTANKTKDEPAHGPSPGPRRDATAGDADAQALATSIAAVAALAAEQQRAMNDHFARHIAARMLRRMRTQTGAQ